MVDPGEFFVVTIGRQYIRFPELALVGRSLQHAHQFDTLGEARREVEWLRQEMPREKKPIGIRRVIIEEVPT